MRRGVFILVTSFGAANLRAQVGYDPQHSPYRDLRETQEVTFFSGYFRAKKDPVQVAPRSGPLVGTHYQWRAGGPANLTFSFGRVASERRVLDPEKTCGTPPPADCKLIGVFRWPVYLVDGGLSLSLTGARSFFHLVPEIKSGMGIATDFHTKADVGDFAFGTRFAFIWGAGMRWVPGGRNRYQLRADFLNHLYSVRYPISYYTKDDLGNTILAQSDSRSRSHWLNNPSLTFGVSYLFSR
jgi:hypothetical protein